jgi:hypothetical protein
MDSCFHRNDDHSSSLFPTSRDLFKKGFRCVTLVIPAKAGIQGKYGFLFSQE